MNKKISLMLVVVLMMSILCMTACGGDKNSEEEPEKTIINVLTNSACGELCKSAGGAIEENMETIDIKVSASGTDPENIRSLNEENVNNEEDVNMVMAQSDVLNYAYYGRGIFRGEQIRGYSALGSFYYNGCQLVVGKYSGIASIEDLKGKTVSVGEEGSSTEFMVKNIFAAKGLKLSDITVENMEFEKSVEAVKNGEIDAMFFIAGAPEREVLELAVTEGTRLISIEGEEIDTLLKTHKYYVPYVIPAGTYAGQEEDVNTIAVKYVMTARDDMDADLVYNFLKISFENKDAIVEETSRDADADPKKALEGMTIPLHPGAEKYYKEIGAL